MQNPTVEQIIFGWYSDADAAYQASSLAKTMKGDRNEKPLKEAWKLGWVERHSKEMMN